MSKETLVDLLVTIVGGGIKDLIEKIFSDLGINAINPINCGQLGNFKTLTYTVTLPESEVIFVRRKLMNEVNAHGNRLTGMYQHGNSMKLFIFDTAAIKIRI